MITLPLIAEDEQERRQFNAHTAVYNGNALLQIAAALRIQSDFVPQRGSLYQVMRIHSNEIVKASESLAEKDALIAQLEATARSQRELLTKCEEVVDSQSKLITEQRRIIDSTEEVVAKAAEAVAGAARQQAEVVEQQQEMKKILLERFGIDLDAAYNDSAKENAIATTTENTEVV